MNFNEKLNKAVKNKQLKAEEKEVTVNETTETPTLSTKFQPSKFLPLRTARYWSDIEAGKEAKINFFKIKENGAYEIHNNATKGFYNLVNRKRLHEVLKEAAWEASYKGASYIAGFKTGSSISVLNIEKLRDQTTPDGEYVYFHGLVNFDLGTKPWIMTKKFYKKTNGDVIVENVPYFGKADAETGVIEWKEKEVSVFNKTFQSDLAKTINMGNIPFPVVKVSNTGQDRNGGNVSDWEEAIDVLKRLDLVEDAIDRAMKTSKTRLFQRRKNGSMDLKTGKSRDNVVARQIMDDVEVIDIVEDPHLDGDALQIAEKSLNVAEWLIVKQDLRQEYYTHTGENIQENHKNNMHGAEIESRGDNKFRRATAKRTVRQSQIKQLINIIMAIAKVNNSSIFSGVDIVSVDIDEVDIRKEIGVVDKVEKLLDLGLISKVQALMKIEAVDEGTALMMLGIKDKHDALYEVEKEEDIVRENQQGFGLGE